MHLPLPSPTVEGLFEAMGHCRYLYGHGQGHCLIRRTSEVEAKTLDSPQIFSQFPSRSSTRFVLAIGRSADAGSVPSFLPPTLAAPVVSILLLTACVISAPCAEGRTHQHEPGRLRPSAADKGLHIAPSTLPLAFSPSSWATTRPAACPPVLYCHHAWSPATAAAAAASLPVILAL